MTFKEEYTNVRGDKQTEEFTIWVKPIWPHVKQILKDSRWANLLHWYPTKKFICLGGPEEEFLDDLEDGSDWWATKVSDSLFDVNDT